MALLDEGASSRRKNVTICGSLQVKAQAMADHASPRSTQLYDRNGDEVTLDEVERWKPKPNAAYARSNADRSRRRIKCRRNAGLKPRGPLLTGKASVIFRLGLDDRPIGSLPDSDLATSLPPDFSPDRFYRSVFAKPDKT